MLGISNKSGRPHIRFETRSEEDREATISAGMKKYKDVDWVFVTPQGAKDAVEDKAVDWLNKIKQKAQTGFYDIEWIDTFHKMYEMYKQGKEMPIDGTPLRMLPHLFTPAEIQNCANVNIQTLEQLASMNEEAISRLGMGGREWKSRAQEAISLSAGKGDSIKISALQTENDDLKTRVSDLENVIRDMQSQLKRQPIDDALELNNEHRGPGRPRKT